MATTAWDDPNLEMPVIGASDSQTLTPQLSGTEPNPDGPQPGDAFATAIRNAYQQYLGRQPSDEEINGHRGNPGGLSAVLDLIEKSPEALAYLHRDQPPPQPTDRPPTPTPTPPPNPWGPRTDDGPPGGRITDPIPPTPNPNPNPYVPPPAPTITLPPAPTPGPAPAPAPLVRRPDFSYAAFDMPEAFKAPTWDEVKSDPRYQAGLDTGMGTLTANRSAQGLLRHGNTLQDLMKFGTNYANNFYDDIYKQKADTYDRNFQDKFNTWETGYNNAANTYATNWGVDRDTFGLNTKTLFDTYDRNTANTFGTYDRNTQARLAEFAPKLHEWDTNTNVGMQNNQNAWDRNWANILLNYDKEKWNKTWPYYVYDNERKVGLGTY